MVQIVNESPGGAIDVKKIHRIRADAWEFWSLAFPCLSSLRSRNDFPNGAPAQPARPECKRLVESIV